MAFKIKDGLAVGSVVSITSTGIVSNAAFNVADGTNGFLKKTGINTWTVDTSTYLTASTGVTSVGGTGTVSGLSLSGTVTTTGNLTLGGTLAVTASNFSSQSAKLALIAPNGAAGVPTFRQIVWSDIDGTTTPTSLTPTSHVIATNTALGSEHTISGAVDGAVLRASAATTANFQRLVWNDIDSKPTTLTPTSHVIATNTALGSEHTISGATAGAVLRASSATAGNFQRLVWTDIDSKPTTISGYGITDAYTKSEVYTKTEVDAVVTGLDFKQSVRVATTANITLSATQTIDGVAVVAGNRVLVKDQSTASQNGIYVVAAGAWSRSTDADNTPAGEVTAGMYCFVEEGSTNADSGWVLTTNDAITLGTTPLAFAQFNGLGQVTAGTGLSKSGSTLNHSNSVTGATVGETGVTRTLAYGGNLIVPKVVYDNQGHITSTADVTLTLPANTSEFGTVSIATDSGFTWGTANTNTSQVADSVGDTLTLVSGTGINLFTSTIAGTDAVKIGHSNSVTGATIAEGGSTRTLAFGGVFNVPSVTYDNQGHVTSSTSVALTLPAAPTAVNSFNTIAVSGQNNVVADSSTDTLTLVAGTGVSITTNDATDTITIGHSDTSTVANLSSDNSTNTFIQDIAFTFDTYGHVTAASVATAAVTINDGGLTLGVSGSGLSGSASFSANQSGASTFTVTSNATAVATPSTIVFRDGSGDFAANIVTAEGVNLDSTIHHKYATATVATVAETVLDSWAGATYRTCKYLVQITQGTNYQSSEILVIHNGTTTSMTEYAIVESNGNLATFSCDYSASNARLKVVMGSATSAAFKMSKTLVVV